MIRKYLFALAAALLLAGVATGCHTAHGFGQDLESAGQGVQNSTQ